MTTEVTTDQRQRTNRIERLNSASLTRVIEPDVELVGRFTRDPMIPEELLSTHGLGLALSPGQRSKLAREELGSILTVGILFETVLMAGFMFQGSLQADFTDPRFTYGLHEVGEETRHSQLFARLLGQLAITARNPFAMPVARRLRSALLPLLLRRPAVLDTMVLVGEEIPDLLQKLMAEHPDTDEYVRAVNRYHRLEEARHLAFARTVVGEHYRRAGWTDRFAVRWIAPLGTIGMFQMIVHPFVYTSVGLPMSTWLKVARDPRRAALRHQAARSVLRALLESGVFRAGRVPRAWRWVCGVDRRGEPAG